MAVQNLVYPRQNLLFTETKLYFLFRMSWWSQLRCRYWLSVGAQPSDPVQRLLFRAGLLPPPPMLAMGRKGGPRDMRPVDPMSGTVMIEGKQKSVESEEDPEVNEWASSQNCYGFLLADLCGCVFRWVGLMTLHLGYTTTQKSTIGLDSSLFLFCKVQTQVACFCEFSNYGL